VTLANELGITFIGYRELQELQARNWEDMSEKHWTIHPTT